MDKYTVLVRIWHTGDKQYYDAGQNVTMTHLAEFQIEGLIAAGVIEPHREYVKAETRAAEAKRKKREAKHGNTDSTSN